MSKRGLPEDSSIESVQIDREALSVRKRQLMEERGLSEEIALDHATLDLFYLSVRGEVNEQLEEALSRLVVDGTQRDLLSRYLDGGKRVPSFYVYLFGEVFETPERHVRRQAVIPELVHSGTLMLDDVIDEHETRRGGKSIWRLIQDEYGLSAFTSAGTTTIYTTALFRMSYDMAASMEETQLITGVLSTLESTGFDDGNLEDRDVFADSPEEWRSFCADIAAIVRLSSTLPAVENGLDAAIDVTGSVYTLGRILGLYGQTVDDAADGDVPPGLDPGTEVVNNAREVVESLQAIDADTVLVAKSIPWYFSAYCEHTDEDTGFDPDLLYEHDIGVY